MTQPKQYAVIARDGFFGDTTSVYSAHETKAAALKAAAKHKVSIPGNPPNQSCAMVIKGESWVKGEIVYRDTIRQLYPVVD